MRIWIARTSEVPVREQLVTQFRLGILSGDLRAGQRLPSTRELARRFQVHANTVSAAYRELERQKWVESRRGSGVFVRRGTRAEGGRGEPDLELDVLIARFFRAAQRTGAPLQAVRRRLRRWLALQPPDHFLLIEPDPELRAIVAHEMRQAAEFPVREAGMEACTDADALAGAMPAALPSQVAAVRRALPPGAECLALAVRSVPQSLGPWLPARGHLLVAVASRWPGFLQSARTLLIAAGFDGDALLLRDARESRWQDGLGQAAAVIADPLTAQSVPRGYRVIPFPVLADASREELRAFAAFVRTPVPGGPRHP
jgi:DNA-binding transcriptional regulator YhcF (GntR family)